MRLARTIFIVAFFVVSGYIAVTNILSAPVSDAPKQSHHVVYFWVCDAFIGALITNEPPTWLPAEDGLPSDENIALIVEARAITVNHWYRGCLKLPPDEPTISTAR